MLFSFYISQLYCFLGNAKPLLEGYEDVDESDNDQDEEQEGSLQNRKLRVLNLQAAKALEVYRKCNPYQSSMAHYCYQQNLLLSNMGSNNIARDRVTKIIKVVSPKQKETKPKLAKPKYEICDPTFLSS